MNYKTPISRVALVLCVILLLPAIAMADNGNQEPPTVPLMEVGVVMPISYRPKGFAQAGDGPNAKSVGLAMRIESGFLGFLLKSNGFHVGEYLGLDFGVTNSGDLTGRLVYGGQATFDVNRDVGVGLRAYFMTVFEDLLPGSFGSHYDNFKIAEVTGRYQNVVARVRFNFAKGDNSGADVHDLGASVRIPTGWKLGMYPYPPYSVGLDYDRLDTKDSAGVVGSGYVIHRFVAVFALAL